MKPKITMAMDRRPPALVVLTLGAALGCKGTASPSTDFGVNITVEAQALTAAQRMKASVGSLQVTGTETEVQQFSIAGAITTGELRFRFIPKDQTGTLTFHFDALDSSGDIFGSGDSAQVTLAATAVSTTITLTVSGGTQKGDGAKCTTASECQSGFCTDGVCCKELCNDICVSCAQAGSAGLCVPYPQGMDPESECTGNSAGGTDDAGSAGGPSDGGPSDAGLTINAPEGGIVEKPNACGGSCSGARSCAAYADAGTSCGEVFCNTRKDVAALECNGKGSCGVSLTACSMYSCEDTTATCRTSCNANVDCQTGFYCNGTNNQCAAQKVDGISCLTDAECNNGHCSLIGMTGAGICCNTVCDSPNTCNGSGAQAGKCSCPTVTNCATGVACQTFYRDADNDGYGDMGTTKVGCADTVPAGYVADDTDCDDNNVNAHPGQTAYFGTARSNGTFDYNCDGTDEKEFKEYPGASCTFCPTPSVGCTTASSTSCSVAGTQASFACTSELSGLGGILEQSSDDLASSGSSAAAPALTITPPIGTLLTCCGCHDASGFLATVACGASAAYYTCGTCSGTKATASTSVSKQQLCQ